MTPAEQARPAQPAERRIAPRAAIACFLLGALGISTAYGLMLLLPLHVEAIGGNEADFGIVASSGTVTAIAAIGALIRWPDRFSPHVVLAAAVVVYALAAAAVIVFGTSVGPLIAIGVVLGTAWAVVYTACPMVMSTMVTDAGRALYFGYLTGTQQIGIGLGPVLGDALLSGGLGFSTAFAMAAGLGAVAAAAVMVAGRLVDRHRRPEERAVATPERTAVPLRASISKIVRSEAVYLLLMVLLFGCLFTTMQSFQTTFATARGLDFSVFYVSYTVAVIASRFLVARAVSSVRSSLVIATFVTVMGAAMGSFLFVGSSPALYALASVGLGLGYGVALPNVQAQAVNVSSENVRPRVLPIAGLVFQTAILGFPVVAGAVISSFGYQVLFAVLLGIATALVAVAWWRTRSSTDS